MFCLLPLQLTVLSRCNNCERESAFPRSREKRTRAYSVLWRKPLYQQKIQQPIDNTQPPPKTSITQRLWTNLGRSVGVTTAIQQVWLNRVPILPINRNRRVIKRAHNSKFVIFVFHISNLSSCKEWVSFFLGSWGMNRRAGQTNRLNSGARKKLIPYIYNASIKDPF